MLVIINKNQLVKTPLHKPSRVTQRFFAVLGV